VATHQDLESDDPAKTFRKIFTIGLAKGIELILPPLRSRRKDILFARQPFPRCIPRVRIRTAIAALITHDWPGNVPPELKTTGRVRFGEASGSLHHRTDLGLTRNERLLPTIFSRLFTTPVERGPARLPRIMNGPRSSAMTRSGGNVSDAARLPRYPPAKACNKRSRKLGLGYTGGNRD